MSITAVIANSNYARFLGPCIRSAETYCDEILIYDDGSTDDSVEVIRNLGHAVKKARKRATGSPVWGSNLGIKDAKCDHLIFLDSDNWLISAPPITEADYTAAAIDICDQNGNFRTRWEYHDWYPMTAEQAIDRFYRTKGMPFPWGGVWKTKFIKPLKWREWTSTQFAADFRTAVDWAYADPTLDYTRTPFMAFREHPAQWSARDDERQKMNAEVGEICRTGCREFEE